LTLILSLSFRRQRSICRAFTSGGRGPVGRSVGRSVRPSGVSRVVRSRVQTWCVRCSINIPNLGDFADPRVVAETARLTEEAGWDGLFIWDQLIGYNQDLVGEFAATNILLAAAALATNRIRLGTQVTPVPRRRPHQLAREIATLDRLSGGRMILGVGLGNPIDNEYGRFGEPTDAKRLAGLLDEGLHAITLLWSGQPVTFRGR
jgi:alkanesulfonate monooxygenase SsuD/methylene tetrahydromethanopterin reductase-like flavin-dependent oxidoreductase (luciferase family)